MKIELKTDFTFNQDSQLYQFANVIIFSSRNDQKCKILYVRTYEIRDKKMRAVTLSVDPQRFIFAR